jgi:3-hydroxyacyl-CoA dehydrogenase/enoyl-CoA hydratase/3-hydroxybutyryl-CoA epimerase
MTASHAAKTALGVLSPRNLELGPFALGETGQDAGPWQHWRMRTDEDGIVWLLFDK